jgi:K+-sensing histidine kinase KdpD
MAQQAQEYSQALLVQEEPELSPLSMSALERHILLLRFLALLLVLILDLFDLSTDGILLAVPQLVLILLGYNGLIYLLAHYVRWLRRPLNYLALDTVIATLAVFLTGGYHSSFFVLYVFIIIGAAFQLELARTLIVALVVGLIYVGACYFSPASLGSPPAQYIVAAKLMLLLVVAVLCGLLLEQLRREHTETERERALAQRLQALNALFQRLNTTLDLPLTLQTVAEAPKALLGAEWATIALLDESGEFLSIVAGAGVEVASLAEERWPVDDSVVATILSSDQPHLADDVRLHSPGIPVALTSQGVSPGVGSRINIPLTLDDEPLGLLDVAYSKRQAFTREDLAFLQALGHEAALAIRNARLYERERQQVARLRSLEELQRGFISAVSHELRTPLTCIKTSVDLLSLESDPAEDEAELVRTIRHHVDRLEAFVADLLEITKLEAGQVTLSRQPTDLCSLVSEAVEILQPLSDRRKQTIFLQLPEAEQRVPLDRRRIEQAVTNILSNAIQYTPRGGQIQIQVSDTTSGMQVCIADNGPGISDEDQAHIFEKFYVGNNHQGSSTGLGLGLYIARQMIELHDGRIWVESQIGEGSTFCFQVPKKVRGQP